jgi:hypothetical protein
MRGRNTTDNQAEKVLRVLLSGQVISLEEIETTLGAHVSIKRLPTYIWELKSKGANIVRNKTGKKIVSLQLVNVDEMKKRLEERNVPVEVSTQS